MRVPPRKVLLPLLVSVIVLATVVSAVVVLAPATAGKPKRGDPGVTAVPVQGKFEQVNGTTAEKQTSEVGLNFTADAVSEVRITVTWTDDASTDPDEVLVELLAPNGDYANQSVTTGSIQLTLKTNVTKQSLDNNTAGWKVTITVVGAGDGCAFPVHLPICRLIINDQRTEWMLTGSYSGFDLVPSTD